MKNSKAATHTIVLARVEKNSGTIAQTIASKTISKATTIRIGVKSAFFIFASFLMFKPKLITSN